MYPKAKRATGASLKQLIDIMAGCEKAMPECELLRVSRNALEIGCPVMRSVWRSTRQLPTGTAAADETIGSRRQPASGRASTHTSTGTVKALNAADTHHPHNRILPSARYAGKGVVMGFWPVCPIQISISPPSLRSIRATLAVSSGCSQ